MSVLKPNTKWDYWTKIKQFFCIHDLHIYTIDDIEVVCWNWTHGEPDVYPAFIGIQLKCKKCGAYYLRCINDSKLYDDFIERYKDKQWSDTCKPVFIRRTDEVEKELEALNNKLNLFE